MRRHLLLYVAAVLLLPVPANAVLTVHEYVSGQKVTLDSNTGNYWYWNMPDFTNMTYDQQQTAIAALGTYGNINGGWHMATHDEMVPLFTYSWSDLLAAFPPTFIDPVYPPYLSVDGREDHLGTPGRHWSGHVWGPGRPFPPGVMLHDAMPAYDDNTYSHVGAWVTTSSAVIPAPGAILLGSIGAGLVGWLRRRRSL